MELKGSFPTLMTPFAEDDEIEEESQRRLVDFLIDAGSHGIAMLANDGESYAVSDEERNRLIEIVVDQVNGRVPVVVTISHFSTKIAIERCFKAKELGADVVMSLPPFFGLRPASLEGVYEYFSALSDTVDIPIIVQDAPGSSGVQMSAEFLAKLANSIKNIKSLKIEAKKTPVKIDEVKKLLKNDKNLTIFGGDGAITYIEELERGSDGTMAACDIPEVTANIYNLYKAGKKKEAESIFNHYLPYINFFFHCGIRYAPKEILKIGGIIKSSRVRAPGLGAEVTWDDKAKERAIYLAKKVNLLALRYLNN